ncbi:MAG: transposase [Capnocytophaga gingivalis]|uniref:transposase n=1 Tax=Capnocytophaga gingivalis TaxID=1017 RepID=UPI00362065C0
MQRYSIERYLLTEGISKQEPLESLFDQGILLVHGLKTRMKNKLIPMWNNIMLRKRYSIECINELLKNKATPYTHDTD